MPLKMLLCCQEFTDPHGSLKPSAKVLAFEYYDGPTSGVLRCEVCSSVWRFEMIDSDDAIKQRVFALAPMPETSFDELVQVNLRFGEPRWPIWAPTWRFENEEQGREVESLVDRVLSTAHLVQSVIVSAGILQPIKAARQLSPSEMFEIGSPQAERDWFAFLSVDRDVDNGDELQ
jgi:hypothetical protein